MAADIVKFEDLEIWKEGMRLARDIYKYLKHCKDFGLKDQMQRAAVSIPSNIAEGFERKSNKDFIRFLYIAMGSSAELRIQIYLTQELGILDGEITKDLLACSKKLSAMINKFIQIRIERFS